MPSRSPSYVCPPHPRSRTSLAISRSSPATSNCSTTTVPLPPKAFDTLLLLVEHHGRLLEKDAFLKRVLPDSFVEEVALAHSISQVRKALRTGTPQAEFIETVPKRGYRFIGAVEAVAPPADPRPSRTRLAVLPFENLSADAQREYVADGLTEEVIAAPGQVDPEHFGVIGRTSMMAYKRTTKSLAAVGAELNAEFLVESSIRFEGDRLRITSRLIRTSDQMQIWSASFDSEPPSVLEFQRELSTAIAHQVRLHLSPERLSALERRQPRQAEAYDLYLRGPRDRSRRQRADGFEDSSTRARGSPLPHVRSVFVDGHRLRGASVHFGTSTGDLQIPGFDSTGLASCIEASDQFERESSTFLGGKAEGLGEHVRGEHGLSLPASCRLAGLARGEGAGRQAIRRTG